MAKQKTENLEKLPAWAQRYISRLKADIEYYQNKLAEAGGATWTPVHVNVGGVNVFHPYDSDVTLQLSSGEISARLANDLESLEIRSSFGRLVVYPQVSNAIKVGIERL